MAIGAILKWHLHCWKIYPSCSERGILTEKGPKENEQEERAAQKRLSDRRSRRSDMMRSMIGLSSDPRRGTRPAFINLEGAVRVPGFVPA